MDTLKLYVFSGMVLWSDSVPRTFIYPSTVVLWENRSSIGPSFIDIEGLG